MVSYHPSICGTVHCSLTSVFMAFVFTLLAYFSNEDSLKQKTTQELKEAMGSKNHDISVYYSARGVLRLVLEKIFLKNPSNKQTLTIGCNSIQAKPMQKAIKSFEKDHPGCEIEYVFIKMDSEYSFGDIPEGISKCDILILYHLWGFAYDFEKVIQVAKDSNVLVFEDLVQAGGMVPLSNTPFLGHEESDIVVWSGALDKTISTIGNGFFIDKNKFLTQEFINKYSDGTRTSFQRFHKLLWGFFGVIVTINLLHLWKIFTLVCHHLGFSVLESVNWLLLNRGKSFDHGVTLAQPSLAALYSVRFTIWMDDYALLERTEKEKLKVFRQNLPDDVWSTLFPHIANRNCDKTDYFMKGISEFFYCFDPFGNLQSFLDEKGLICVNQQSWMAYENDRPESKEQTLLDGMMLLPNFHCMSNDDIQELAKHLEKYYLSSREKANIRLSEFIVI